MKNCLYYSMFIDNEWDMKYYSMAYYSLKTLSEVYDGSFDVLVFYYIYDNIDINHFKLNDKYNICTDFDFVKCVKTDYTNKYNVVRKRPYKHDSYMSKWYHLQKALQMGYDKIFFLDCDSMFVRNPSDFFNKYENGKLWTLSCIDPVNDILYPDIKNMNSGQFIIDSKSIRNKKSLYNNIVKKRMYLSKKGRKLLEAKKIDETMLEGYEYFNEQYCGQFTLMDIGLKYEELNYEEITHPADPVIYRIDGKDINTEEWPRYTINLKDTGSYISDIQEKIYVIHYSSGKSIFWVPYEMQTNQMRIEYSDFFKKEFKEIDKKKEDVKITNKVSDSWDLLFT